MRAAMRISLVIVPSVAFPCTAPPGKYGVHPHSFTPRGERSVCPHSVRSFTASFFSKPSVWSPSIFSASSTSIFPLFSFSNSSHRARRAFGELSPSFGSNWVASSVRTFESRAQLEPASTPSFVRHSLYAFSPSSSWAISPVFRSPSSQSFAYPPLFPASMIFVYSSIEPAYCSALRARTNSAFPFGSHPSNCVIVVACDHSRETVHQDSVSIFRSDVEDDSPPLAVHITCPVVVRHDDLSVFRPAARSHKRAAIPRTLQVRGLRRLLLFVQPRHVIVRQLFECIEGHDVVHIQLRAGPRTQSSGDSLQLLLIFFVNLGP